MKTIIVTGNIGSGKSTVSKMLLDVLPGYTLFDVDAYMHQLYEDAGFRSHLHRHLGTDVRSEVSDLVFANPEQRVWLENVSKSYATNAIGSAKMRGPLLVDFPLYYEHGISLFSTGPTVVVAIACSLDNQRARVAERGRFTPEKLTAIMANQYSTALKSTLADYVIDTNQSLDHVRGQAVSVAESIKTQNLRERFLKSFTSEEMWENIERQYGDPSRHYHGLTHLVYLFEQYDKVAHLIKHKEAVQLAIWYHDYYYDTDIDLYHLNESRSAAALWKDIMAQENRASWFGGRFPDNKREQQVQIAVEMILATKGHRITSPYILSRPVVLEDAKMFLDMDLSSLAAPEEVSLKLDAKIRFEFQQFGIKDFAKGRIEAMSTFAKRERLFQSEAFAHLEEAAKANLATIIAQYQNIVDHLTDAAAPTFDAQLRAAFTTQAKK